MIESLADQWMRASREVRSLPSFIDTPDLLDATVREARLRRGPHDGLEVVDKVTFHALMAVSAVLLRWMTCHEDAASSERKIAFDANVSDEDFALDVVRRDEAVARWAADAIARRRVSIRELEAEPTVRQLADWLERFSEALALALARVEMVRAPTRILEGLLDLRADRAERAERRRVPGVFASAELEHWRFVPPKNHPLTLPFEGTNPTTKGSVKARSVLTGGLLRAYLATWQLLEESEMDDGCFVMDVRHVIRDLYGVPMYREPKRGIERPPPAHERTFKQAFNTLQRIQIEGIGEMKLGDSKLGRQPQWLLTCMEFPKAKVYQHAPVAMLALRNFIQVPQAVLRLEAEDTALGMGVASMWRHHVGDVLRGPGHYRRTLQQLANALNEDAYTKSSKRGAGPYYRDLAERLGRVVRDGQLGDVHFEGEGPLAVVTLTPSPTLETVYQPLATERPTGLDTAARDAKAAELAARKRRPGRPRRDV